MQRARPATVLGRFDSTRVTASAAASTFFRQGDRYFVNTQGDDGRQRDYEIAYTFGVAPLQQYLVELPGGRMQALTTAWDARPKANGGQRWFSLNPGSSVAHTDEEHWSGRLNNWNFRCADCHSTAVRKNYDPETGRFRTSWSEVSVGCEACHGPGAEHTKWARYPTVVRTLFRRDTRMAARLTERRDVRWVRDSGAATARRSTPRTTDREIDVCAQCHSRRIHIADGYTAGAPLLDYYIPFLIETGAYFADGQQNDEVYNYGSFLQSRMYRAGVTCADCHDPHTQRLRRPGAQTCAQCHDAGRYDSPAHHLHGPHTGATCITCHMPPRTYMQIDPRHDHAFTVPRPDLSVALGVPNACSQCHVNRDAAWAEREWRSRFRGAGARRFAHAFAADERDAPGAADSLARVADDSTESVIVRASAVARLANRPNPAALDIAKRHARDPNALIRLAALSILDAASPQERADLAVPLLRDERRAVRQGAAWVLAPVADSLHADVRGAFATAAAEFVASQRYNADQPEHRHALGAFYARLGQLDSAATEYRAVLRLAPRFAQAYIDLAEVFRVQARVADAERVLRDAVHHLPSDAGLQYALGTLLANDGRLAESLVPLRRAVALRPDVVEFVRGLDAARDAIRRRRSGQEPR